MRTSFVYFALLVQLVCTLPVLGEKYIVHSKTPNRFIVSTGHEKPGEPVETTRFKSINTIVDVSAPIIGRPTEGEIAGKTIGRNKPLFVGIGRHGGLEWQRQPYRWEFSASHERPFHVVSIPGTQEVWVDNRDTVEVVRRGHGDSALWRFDQV